VVASVRSHGYDVACHASVAAIATNLEDDHVKEYLNQLGTMHKVLAQVRRQHRAYRRRRTVAEAYHGTGMWYVLS
jgi:hypothetical protein